MSVLESFHPAVAAWFARTFDAPTPAQSEAWPAIRSGRNVLVAAPTGSGKTFAAFLAAIDQLVKEGLESALPDETRVVYVSPLKALSNDIHRNLRRRSRESPPSSRPSACRTCRSDRRCARAIRRRASAPACGAPRRISW